MNAFFALVLFVSAPADADTFARVEQGVPTRISIGPGDFGQMPEAVAQSRIIASARLGILADTANLFGTISAEAQLRATYRLIDRLWVAAGLSVFELRNVINASVSPTAVGLGPLTTSVHVMAYRGARTSVAPYARILWPTSTAYNFARPFGIEVGVSDLYELHPMLSLIGGVSLPLSLTGLGGRVLTTFTPTIAAELALHPWKWFELLGGAEVRFGVDRAGAFEYFAPKFALRFYPVSGLIFELRGMLPMGGIERTDYVFGGGLGWALDRPAMPSSARGNANPVATPIVKQLPAEAPASMPAEPSTEPIPN